jgi:outer membrane protein OmpA-like peptidoglycan-associated protein
MKHLLFFLIVYIFSTSASIAQNYLGVHASNFNGVMGTDLQPASFVDSRFKVDINLGSSNGTLWTNAFSFDTRDMPKWWLKSFADTNYSSWMNPDSTFFDRYMTRNYDSESKKVIGFYNNIQVDVLNFMFHIQPKIAIGATVKFRSITNIDDVDPKLALLAQNDLDIPSLWNQKFNEKLLDLNHMSWMEYGFVYSQVLKDDGEHFMKMGGKAKWLAGYTAAYVHTKNFNYNLFNSDTSQYLSGDFSYGHSTGLLDGEQSLKSASKFGLGLDLGFVYEWRPDWKEYKYDMDGETNIWRQDLEKYKLRAGVSILDIGGMKFTKGGLSRDFSVETTKLFNLQVFDTVTSLASADQVIDSLINDPTNGWSAQENPGKTFFMNLPTAVSLQFDYHIWKWFYVNATGMISVQSSKNPNRLRVPNQIAITPSFDHAWFGLHLPFSYNRYSGFKAGIGTRLGPLTVGVNDFGVLFASGKKINGAAIYAGLRLPIVYTSPNDIDLDKVSDEKDVCIDVPGIWAFRGCPDNDNDGIQDSEDACPFEAGLAEFKGCPDKDGDKIPDMSDACPELAGLIAFNGCPDRDNDSIIDTKDDCPDLPGSRYFNGCPDRDNDSIIDPQDDCPDEPGLQIFKGCPDRDNDGIKDDDDACPDNPGPLSNQGCPDSDKDGIFDFLDECPEKYGPEDNKGCPWPDTDNDGLIDKFDECPNLAGPTANKGCPYQDTDSDGVLDKDDDCPSTPGTIANKGCPELEKEVEEILKTAFDNLEFETGKDLIKSVSIPSLTELAEVLKKKPTWGLQISGHTDNVGDDQKNLVLSKKRAEAVKNFMIAQGIEANRLRALYFGETMPVATNDTPEGRQKNRRVEMVIIFK